MNVLVAITLQAYGPLALSKAPFGALPTTSQWGLNFPFKSRRLHAVDHRIHLRRAGHGLESLHAKVEENKLNPYGEVTGGTLTMKGAIRPARAQRCDIGSEEYFFKPEPP